MEENQVTQLKIGTRGSPLAMLQAEEVRNALMANQPELNVEIVEISTTGDRIQDRTLAAIGGKGLFTKEIEQALLDGTVDIAVHSAKDMLTEFPEGLTLGPMLPREDTRDGIISINGQTLSDMPSGSVVGTASLRRQAQILAVRQDLNVIPFRGNVQTRLRKLSEGQADATLLAVAGLKRLNRMDVFTQVLDPETLLPAVGQGAIALELRAGDHRDRRIGGHGHGPPARARTWCLGPSARAAALDGARGAALLRRCMHEFLPFVRRSLAHHRGRDGAVQACTHVVFCSEQVNDF